MDKIVGIDLGTSTSCLAVVLDGEPVVIADGRGNRVTPSYIHVMEDGRILVGPQAKAEVISDPYSTIWATKRLAGRRFSDPEVQDAVKHFGFEILEDEDGGVKVKGRNKELTPTEVGAIILKYLTRIGKKKVGQEIRRAVITVPAYFTDPQRKATRESGAMIGLDVVRLINEPTAAALAYGYDQDAEQTLAVYDLGGGTFDLSILTIGQGVFEVIATDGDSYLGGEDFDNALVDFLVKDFKKKFEIDIYNDKMAHQRVKDAAERTKIALSEKNEVEINLPAICPDLNRWAGVEAVITRNQYEKMVEDLVDRTVAIFQKLLADVSVNVADIDNLILVGGMTRMPLVKRKVEEIFGRPPDDSVNPDEAVALGAAIHAASLSGQKIKRKSAIAADRTRPGAPPRAAVTPPAVEASERTEPGLPPPFEPGAGLDDTGLPIEPERLVGDEEGESKAPGLSPTLAGLDDFFAAPASSPTSVGGEAELPAEEEAPAFDEPVRLAAPEDLRPMERDETPMAMDGEDEEIVEAEVLDEEEAMAPGEIFDYHPVSAGPIIRDEGEPLPAVTEGDEEYAPTPVLLDVLSQSVGIAHFGGHFVPLIKRFSKLPARATQVFTTCTDNQARIRISVLQGEDKKIENDTPLGGFVLEGIEKGRRGLPEIEVIFDIDQSGLFKVMARDKKTGSEQQIQIENVPLTAPPQAEGAEVKS